MRKNTICFLLLLTSCLAGCGYSSKPAFRTDVKTIAVPLFNNKSFYQGYELELSEAIIKNIELRTPYKVTGAAQADTILTGTIIAVDQTVLSQQRVAALPQEMELRLTVDLEWKNARTGQVLRNFKGFQAAGRYIPSRPVGETLVVGEHQAIQLMADQIVGLLRSDW